jgi:hypothetical protein
MWGVRRRHWSVEQKRKTVVESLELPAAPRSSSQRRLAGHEGDRGGWKALRSCPSRSNCCWMHT